MSKEQLIAQIEEIDYIINAYTITIEWVQWAILELLRQKEWICRELKKLDKQRTKIWFTNKNQDETAW